MSDLAIGLLSVLLATNTPVALSNLIARQTGISIHIPDPNDPVEKAYQKLLAEDDAAQAEVDQWIKAKQERGDANDAELAALRARIQQRLDQVRQAYEDFLKQHPNHARARVAYGSFLNDIQEEDAARVQWEKACELDPKLPAAWNNLGNWHGHNGSVSNAFRCYLKALELRPTEPVYYENLAITMYMFRRDAAAYFNLSEHDVLQKAMALYRKALELDPENFILATEYAQSYYGFKPPKTGDANTDRKAAEKHFQDAMAAWTQAAKLARDEIERQGVFLHFARWQIDAGQFDAARSNLALVTHSMYDRTKSNLLRKLDRLQAEARLTNALAPPAPAK